MKHVIFAGTVLALALMVSTAHAKLSAYYQPIQELLESDIKGWLQDPRVIDSINAQNAQNAELQQDEIKNLDDQWRAERKTDNQPLIDKVLAKPLSDFLKEVKEQYDGLFLEIFVMDNRGLNVGQSDVTSDYWQGDEVKWQQTYLAGPEGLVIGSREYDESTGKFLIQVSMTVVDPNSQQAIGAATVGVSLVKLMRTKMAASASP